MTDTPASIRPSRRAADEKLARVREIAFAVRSAMVATGLKQRVVAEQVGMSESALSRALRAQREFYPHELDKLKEILGIQLEYNGNFDPNTVPAAMEARRDFARRLRLRREELGWGTARVSNGIVELSGYQELEDGLREPSVFELMSLPGRLGVSLVWLVHGLPSSGDPEYS